jgi:Putative sensor
MNRSAPRSIDQYLRQLREELAGEDAALIQDALYDAEEYLRAEVAAHPEKSESDVLELIASTYGAPDEVAGAYRDTEAKVKAAMTTPRKMPTGGLGAFFGVFLDPRVYTSLFFMLLSLATGIIYFTLAVTGLSLSAGLSVLIIGIPFFLVFIALTRVISLAEGRLIEAMTGERMPRRPIHQTGTAGFWSRVGEMLKDRRTWTTFAYLILMLPLGIAYFVIAVVGLSLSLAFTFAPLVYLSDRLGWFDQPGAVHLHPSWLESLWALPFMMLAGILLLTLVMHVARGVGRLHAMYAKALLVSPAARPSAAGT